MTEEIEFLKREYQRLQAEYRPLQDQAIQVHEELLNAMREAGLVYTVTTSITWRDEPVEDEFETLEEAKSYAKSMDDSDEYHTLRLFGPGIDTTHQADWQ